MRMILSALALVAAMFCVESFADTGKYAATREEVGNTAGTRVISLSTNAYSVAISSAADNRPDETCFNNSASHVFISSMNASVAHFQRDGFIVLSSATFRLGAFTGATGVLINSGAGELRCWRGTTE